MMSARTFRTILWLVVAGWLIYVFETGCAGTGKQEAWEECANVIYSDCFLAEDVLDCGYEHYRECIDGS